MPILNPIPIVINEQAEQVAIDIAMGDRTHHRTFNEALTRVRKQGKGVSDISAIDRRDPEALPIYDQLAELEAMSLLDSFSNREEASNFFRQMLRRKGSEIDRILRESANPVQDLILNFGEEGRDLIDRSEDTPKEQLERKMHPKRNA